MSERGQTGDVPVEQACELSRLGFAQLGELSSDANHGAVVLAQLNGQITEGLDLRRVAHGGEGLGHLLRRGGALHVQLIGKRAGAILRKTHDRLGTVLGGQVAQGGECEIVRGGSACGSTVSRQREDVPRTAPTTLGRRPVRSPLVRHHEAPLDQGGEVSADPSRGHGELIGELGCRLRATLEERACHTLRGLAGEFHNTIVA